MTEHTIMYLNLYDRESSLEAMIYCAPYIYKHQKARQKSILFLKNNRLREI